MSDKKNIFSSKFFQKLKNVKHIEIIIAVVFIALLLLLYFNSFSSNSSKNISSETTSTSLANYYDELEVKLENVLKQIEGVGNVKVMITVSGSSQLVYATSTEETNNTNTSGSTTISNSQTTTSPVLVNSSNGSKPLVVQEILPQIQGIIVVCSGANNYKVRLEVLKAIQTLLPVSSSSIEILVGK